MTTEKNGRKRKLFIAAVLSLLAGIAAGGAYAAFSDTGKVLGSTFSVGSADIKMLIDASKGTEATNLTDELSGPSFTNIGATWTKDYLLKFYNSSTSTITLTTNAKYSTANDPGELRQYIYVEPIAWDDANLNGIVDSGEAGQSYGKKTIVKWSTEGFSLGNIDINSVKPLILRFSTENLSETKQGKTAVFDFEFDGVGL